MLGTEFSEEKLHRPPGLDAVARARHGGGDPAGGGDLEMPGALNTARADDLRFSWCGPRRRFSFPRRLTGANLTGQKRGVTRVMRVMGQL